MKFLPVVLVLLFSIPSYAAEVFERYEINYDVKVNSNIFAGIKDFGNHGDKHRWIRYRWSGTPYQVEYRNVQFKDGSRNENWYRFQYKHADSTFFYWSRFEYRHRDGVKNHLRYRPRIGFKKEVQYLGKPYIFIEPHWDLNDNRVPIIMTYVGTKWSRKKYDFGLFVQTQSDGYYDMKRAFIGIDLLYKI